MISDLNRSPDILSAFWTKERTSFAFVQNADKISGPKRSVKITELFNLCTVVNLHYQLP